MKRKTLSVILSLLMTLTAIPFAAVPAAADGPELVSTAAEFANMSAGGSYKLGADITVAEPYASDFGGSFDGDGHRITLAIETGSAYTGLFKRLIEGAEVKNLTLEGSVAVTGSSSYTGALAGEANAYKGSTAGVINVKNVLNRASVSGYRNVGGIIGNSSSGGVVNIINCANEGAISASNINVAGIAGNLTGEKNVKNCINTGNVSGFNGVAGLVGYAAEFGSSGKYPLVENCYTTGSIALTEGSTNSVYAIFGSGRNITIKNTYALSKSAGEDDKNFYYESTATGAKVEVSEECGFKSEAEMKADEFVATLNKNLDDADSDGFMAKAGSYPVHKWQTPTASVSFTITPENATLTLKDTESGKTAHSSNSGASRTVALPAGSYSYSVSCDGYTTKNSESDISVSAEQAEAGATLDAISVSLEEDASAWQEISFSTTPAEAALRVIDATDQSAPFVVSPTAEGGKTYKLLKAHTYIYAATAPENSAYEDANGLVNTAVSSQDIALAKITALEISGQTTEYYQRDKFKASGMVVSVKHEGSDDGKISADSIEAFAEKGVTISGFDSENAVQSQTISVSYRGVTTTYTVEIKEKLFQSSFWNALAGKLTDAKVVYGGSSYNSDAGEQFIDDEEEEALASNNGKRSNSTVTASFTMAADAPKSLLSFDYKAALEYIYYDKFTVSVNGTTVLNYGGGYSYSKMTSYKNFSVPLKAGDSVVFSYLNYYSSYDGHVYLKNLELSPLYTLSFTGVPAGAELVLKEGENPSAQDPAIAADEEGGYSYTVEGGKTYSYSVSKFNWSSDSGSVSISGDKTQAVNMSELAGFAVIFDISLPEGLSANETHVTVRDKASGALAYDSETDESAKLPAGTYTYSVEHPRCEAVTNAEFTLSAEGRIDESESNKIELSLTRKLAFEDFFAEIDGVSATNDSEYPFTAVGSVGGENNYLESSNPLSSTGKISLDFSKNARLTFDYWTSVYSYSTSYGLMVYKNGNKLSTYNGQDSEGTWKEAAAVDVKAGDKIELRFSSYSSNYYGSNKARIKNINVEPLYTVSFETEPADAEISFKKAEDGAAEIAGEGSVYTVPTGSYAYRVSKFGYLSAEGSVSVTDADIALEKISLSEAEKYSLSFDITLPADADSNATKIVVKSGNSVVYDSGESENCSLPAGSYSYTIANPLCETIEGETELGADAVIAKTLERKLVFSDFFSAFSSVTAENYKNASGDTQYGFDAVKEDGVNTLKTNNQNRGSSKAAMKLSFGIDAQLSFEYKVGSEANYDKFTIEKNGTTLETKSGSVAWTEYKLNVESGDTVVLQYAKDYSGDSNGDTVELRNFKVQSVYALNFTLATEGATLILKNEEGKTLEADSGTSYTVPDGSYSYEVSKFGYESRAGSVEIDGAGQDITVEALTALGTAALSFTVEPADAEITLRQTIGGLMTANEGVYTLPVGYEYEYTISKSGYVTESGSIILSEDKTISAELVYAGEAWDGEAASSEPDKDSDGTTYLIDNAAELAWFAAQVNSGNSEISAKLTQNINLNEKPWTSIGTDSNEYKGSFDGNGKTVTGLKGTDGLFYFIGGSGTVKNLSLSVDITHSAYGAVGGLANTSRGTIKDCIVSGSVSSSSDRVGGIVGRSDQGSGFVGLISGSVNRASVSYTGSSSSSVNLGGIVGQTIGTIENCYNAGSVSATNSAGYYIGGLAGSIYTSQTSGVESAVINSYNTGSVSVKAGGRAGAIAGRLDASTVSKVYYLSGTAENAYSTQDTNAAEVSGFEALSSENMRKDSFAATLGSAFNADDKENPINSGYPPLKWQGGQAPDVSEEEGKLAEDKAALSLSPSEIRSALTLSLAASGENGSLITWKSSNTEIVSDGGAVTLPENGSVEVTMTATLTLGPVSDTKSFVLTVYSEAATVSAELADIAQKLGTRPISPVYGRDTNAAEMVKSAAIAVINAGSYSAVSAENIAVSVSDRGQNTASTSGDDTVYIADDGALTYYYTDPDTANTSNAYAYVGGVSFNLSAGSGSAVYGPVQVNLPWDGAKVKSYLNDAAASLSFDTIKGENTDSSAVTKDLSLPKSLEGKKVSVEWSATDPSVLAIEEGQLGYTNDKGVITAPAEDKESSVEAVLKFTIGDADIYSDIKTISFTVKGEGAIRETEMEDIMAAYTLDKLKYSTGGEAIDAENVTGNIQLLTSGDLTKLVGHYIDMSLSRGYTISISQVDKESGEAVAEEDAAVEQNGYRLNVYRSLPDMAGDVTATLKLRLYHNPSGEEKTKILGDIVVKAVPQEDIDAELAMMERVKAGYRDALLGENEAADRITQNMHSFHEAYLGEDGELVWAYSVGEMSGAGIVPDTVEGASESAGYDRFKSSRPSLIQHENLVLTAQPEYNTAVTVESTLSSEKFASYAERYPESESMKKLTKVPVSAEYTVIGEKGEKPGEEPQAISVSVSIDGKGFESFSNISEYEFTGAADRDWTAWDALSAALSANNYGYDGGGSYVSAISDASGTELREKEHGKLSGWKYSVNGIEPDIPLSQYYLDDGDLLYMYYSGEKDEEPGDEPGEEPGEDPEKEEENKGGKKGGSGTSGGAGTSRTAVDVNGGNAAAENAENNGGSAADSAENGETEGSTAENRAAEGSGSESAAAESGVVVLSDDGYGNVVETTVLGEPVGGFSDVGSENWYGSAVKYVLSEGLFKGTSETSFNPLGKASREQVMTVLARYAGETANSLGDGLAWAVENGISDGSEPEAPVTREQFVTMLYRLVQAQGGGFEGEWFFPLENSDAGELSAWADEAMHWCVMKGIITGYEDGRLGPKDEITRAQMAAIMQRMGEL